MDPYKYKIYDGNFFSHPLNVPAHSSSQFVRVMRGAVGSSLQFEAYV